ncbi:MAG TPA: hypothetical protein VF655_07135, partial [Allosphingosinicella sp.]
MIFRKLRFAAAAAVGLLAVAAPADSQTVSPSALTYADLADLGISAPIAAHVRVTGATALKPASVPDVRPGLARLLVQAQVVSLIRAPEGLASRISYVVDLPRDAKGKAPKLKKGTELLLLAAPVTGRSGEVRLTAPDAQIAYSAERAEVLRKIIRDSISREAPPRISGIGRAFHVPGAIPGESE